MSDLISFVSNSAASTADTGTARAGLASNFDTFLTLLTAQMQNQDPLSPVDSTEFTNQLVQFAGVEQQIETNSSINALVTASNSSVGAALSGYLGQRAQIDTPNLGFYGEPVTWSYALPSDATKVTLAVQDGTGRVIWSGQGEAAKGQHEFEWDGSTLSGNPAPTDGVYTLNVIARNIDDEPLDARIGVLADVTGVDMSHGEPALTTRAGVYSYTDIVRVTQH